MSLEQKDASIKDGAKLSPEEGQRANKHEDQQPDQSDIEEQYLGGEFSSDIIKKMRKDPTAIGKLFKEGKYPYTDRIPRRAFRRKKPNYKLNF